MELEKQFSEISELIQKSKIKVFSVINRELIELYWSIGEYISNKIEGSGWGKSIVKNLSDFLRENHSDMKGFSSQNLWRMKQFYETYKDSEKLSAMLREISWTNNIMIMSKTKSIEEKEFYIRLAIKEKYSSRELERQLDSGYFERCMLSNGSLPVLSERYPDAAGVFRDTYVLEFLNLPEKFQEKDL